MRSLAIALLSVGSVSAIAPPTPAAAEGAPLGPWRQVQFVDEGSVLDLGLDNNFLTLSAPNTAFSPPEPLDAPRRREPAGTRFAPPNDLGTPGRRETRWNPRHSLCTADVAPPSAMQTLQRPMPMAMVRP